MFDRDHPGDLVSGARRSVAEQHPRSAELRQPARSPRSTSRLTSRSTITYLRYWRRLRHAGESSENYARGTTRGCSATHVGAPWPRNSSAHVRAPDPPSAGVRGEGSDGRRKDALIAADPTISRSNRAERLAQTGSTVRLILPILAWLPKIGWRRSVPSPSARVGGAIQGSSLWWGSTSPPASSCSRRFYDRSGRATAPTSRKWDLRLSPAPRST